MDFDEIRRRTVLISYEDPELYTDLSVLDGKNCPSLVSTCVRVFVFKCYIECSSTSEST